MELRQLRHFVAVVDTGNLSRAAERVAISQPALTRSIKNLEELLGVELLERKPRGVTPTEAGVSLYHHATIVLNACQRLAREVREIERGVTGTVRVGIASMFATHVMDRVAAQLAADHPRLALVVTEGFFEDLLRGLVDGRYDVVFSNFPQVPVSADLHLEPLLDVVSSVVASARHPLARRRDLQRRDLVDQRWVIADLPHAQDSFEKYFAIDGLPAPGDVYRTNSLNLMVALVATGRFVSTLPEHLLAREFAAGTLRRLALPGGGIERKAGLIYRESRQPRPAVDHFMSEVRRTCVALAAGR
ncbi:MAG: LysR family transcriptional regulator [Steroidobacteraceae bacterium]|jgi:DNA-binding transcriptional LysR family regulator|nr:LysR family transcriptional regulator [Steroidobacteraceae bacterium]